MPAWRFTLVRCCSSLQASISHDLTAKPDSATSVTRIGSCNCLSLMVTSDRSHKGLSPSITAPCPSQPRSRLRLAPSGLRLRTSLPCLRLRLLARRTQGHTKAVVVDAVRRLEPVAVRRTTNPGGADPTAATDHAVRARCGARGVGHGTTRVISMPILTPLPNIAVHVMHVMQPQTFGFLPPTGWLTLPTLAQNQPEVARNQA
jgi:hypothetical protein